MSTDDDPAVETNERLGTRVARFPTLSGASAWVEVPPPRTDDATISVSAETYDDEDGHVVVRVGGDVSVELGLSVDEAHALAETIDRAADEAEADI